MQLQQFSMRVLKRKHDLAEQEDRNVSLLADPLQYLTELPSLLQHAADGSDEVGTYFLLCSSFFWPRWLYVSAMLAGGAVAGSSSAEALLPWGGKGRTAAQGRCRCKVLAELLQQRCSDSLMSAGGREQGGSFNCSGMAQQEVQAICRLAQPASDARAKH